MRTEPVDRLEHSQLRSIGDKQGLRFQLRARELIPGWPGEREQDENEMAHERQAEYRDGVFAPRHEVEDAPPTSGTLTAPAP